MLIAKIITGMSEVCKPGGKEKERVNLTLVI